MKMLNNKSLTAIVDLIENKSINKKDISNKKLLKKLENCNAVETIGKPSYLILKNENVIYKIINSFGYKDTNLNKIKNEINKIKSNTNRLDDTLNYSDSKMNNSKSFSGLTFSTIKPVNIIIDGVKNTIDSHNGSGLFFHYSIDIKLEKDTILVGVENPQCIWYIKELSFLFDNSKDYLFLSISEFKTKYHYDWLKNYEGEYLHFGDFDLPAIKNIYQGRIIPRLTKSKKHSFFIPDGLYDYMKSRKYKKDFAKQLSYVSNTESNNIQLQKLITFIKDNKITLEQEMLRELKNTKKESN